MKYYSINNSLNPKIVGKNPQSETIDMHYGDDNSKFINNIYFEKIDFEPILPLAILHRKAKVTDLISKVNAGSTISLLVSEKLKNILTEYSNFGIQYFATKIILNSEIFTNYFYTNVFEAKLYNIDFRKTNVFEAKNLFDRDNKLNIQNFDEFEFHRERIERIGYPNRIIIENINLIDSLIDDFFILKYVHGGIKYVVSEKLKVEIEQAGCTGIEFQPIELSLNEWLHSGEREKIYGKV